VIVAGPVVARLRRERRMTRHEVAAAMRKRGLRGSNALFVAIAEAGLWTDIDPVWVLVLADALGSDLSEVTGRRHLAVARSGR
jgi:hypothetical protein